MNLLDSPIIHNSLSGIYKLDEWIYKLYNSGIHFLPSLIIGILVFYLGIIAIKKLLKISEQYMFGRDYDPTIVPFIKSILKFGLYLFLIIIFLMIVGVNTASFITILGAAGLALGLALQGSLSNFAGGILVLIFKPFRVGDYIVSGTFSGTVQEINILFTTIISTENKAVIIPNSIVANKEVVNNSAQSLRRIELSVILDYGSDVDLAIQTLISILENHPKVLKDKKNVVGINSLLSYGVKLDVHFWVNQVDFMELKYHIQHLIFTEFKNRDIKFAISPK